MSPGNVKYNGHWCPQCARKQMAPSLKAHRTLVLKEIKRIARQKGGRCLSTEYTNNKQKLEFVCAVGHHFSAQAKSVKNRGTWCKRCARKHNRLRQMSLT